MRWPARSGRSSRSGWTTATSTPMPTACAHRRRPTVMAAAAKVIQPDRLVWVVVGDRSRIESSLRELNLGDIHLVDADGNAVPTS